MLLIGCNHIKKYYGERLILNIDGLKIYANDRIGVVGRNGVGKTTLINILSKRLDPDEGYVKLAGTSAFISQLDEPEEKYISAELASRFCVPSVWKDTMSGGEKTRFKLAQALGSNSQLIFADEPTSNMDLQGIDLLTEKLKEHQGALVVISHDRSLLDNICNQIIELEFGRIKVYKGNYSDYRRQKDLEIERAQFEYEEYTREKNRLKETIQGTKAKVQNIKRPPKRMGNSEARLHKMGGQRAKAKLDKAVKNLEKRIEHLDVKEKPRTQAGIKLDIYANVSRLNSKIVIEGKDINKSFGDKVIFNDAEFTLYNGAKAALIGPNGCGKSTLLKMIINKDSNIKVAQGAKIGYFSQELDILNGSLNIIENVMESSIYPEGHARLLLARLLFRGEDIYRSINVLSGGERVKVSFAKILLQDINLLILDEPTNYMDIDALEAIEDALIEYDRTLLFVSHDRRLVDKVANQLMVIDNCKINIFPGTYEQYLNGNRDGTSSDKNKEDITKEIFILENRLSEVLSKLSISNNAEEKEALDRDYFAILADLKRLKT